MSRYLYEEFARSGEQRRGLTLSEKGRSIRNDGVGHFGEICGVLTGGAYLLSLCAAKGSDHEVPHEGLPVILWELTDWFRKRTESGCGGSKCDEILAKSPDKRACVTLIVETYEKVQSMLESHKLVMPGRWRNHE